eukprot:285915-Chlamydomonas_euryale.AAC.1
MIARGTAAVQSDPALRLGPTEPGQDRKARRSAGALNAGRNPRAALPSCHPGTQTTAWRLK